MKKKVVGLENLGNTCYMNSVLQAICNLSIVYKYFLNNKHIADMDMVQLFKLSENKFLLSYTLAELIQEMNETKFIITPYKFKKTLGQYNPIYIGNKQEDAHDLLIFILSRLNEELNKVFDKPNINEEVKLLSDKNLKDIEMANSMWRLFKKREDSFIIDNFYGQFKSTIICQSCKKTSESFDQFVSLQLAIPQQETKSLSIFDCLEGFIASETLRGENKYYCTHCKKQVDTATKKFELFKIPNLLIIHIKRFDYIFRRKLTQHIDFPVTFFDVEKFISPNQKNNIPYTIYNLMSIINHYGDLDGGHYTAYCKGKKSWYSFNDSSVTKIQDPLTLITPNAYILFYQLGSTINN
jgi:ubiquitin carboxyl-terminal hydrolase 8